MICRVSSICFAVTAASTLAKAAEKGFAAKSSARFTPAAKMKLDEVTGGSPYGATTITGGDGSRQPSANELDGARYQGRVIAETAKKLHG